MEPDFPIDDIRDGLIEYQNSAIMKPDFYKIAFQWPPSVARDPQRRFEVQYTTQTLGFMAHGTWAHNRPQNPIFQISQGDVPAELTNTEFMDDSFMDVDDICLNYWPCLSNARDRSRADIFRWNEYTKHFSGLPPIAFFGLPVHILMNLPGDFGIRLDALQPASHIMNVVSTTLQNSITDLEITNAFNVVSKDVELQFCNDSAGSKILKEIRLWLDGDLSRTIRPMIANPYKGVTNVNELVLVPSTYPPTTAM
ncbi:hypothetical protein CASFOL_012500 [Castilleja foliolosa]